MTRATVWQSAGPVAPGTHSEQAVPGRRGHCASTAVRAMAGQTDWGTGETGAGTALISE
jgi:hypothetical protein